MQGYNPSASLLPGGGGAIQAMSGGGGMGGIPPTPLYNASESLIPRVGGEVAAYRGGFFADDMEFIGGNTPTAQANGPSPTSGPGAAAGPTAATANAAPTPIPAPTASGPTVTAANTVPTPVPSAANAGSDSKTKAIMLFGKTITLEDPKNIRGGVFTSAQKEALAVFGLDGPGLSDSKKKDVLISLYEGQCNTDKSLIFQVDCKPMREIVQSLALNLLGKIKDHEAAGNAVNENAGNPRVTAEKVNENFRVCIEFTPAQLPLLSKYKVEEFVQSKRTNEPKNANAASPASPDSPASPASPASTTTGETMIEIKPHDITKGDSDIITTLGIKNPDIWCYAIAGIQFMFSIPQMRDEFSNLDCSKPLSIPSKKDDIRALTTIEPNDALCVLKWAFGELSQNTTKFSDSDYVSKIAGNKTIPINTPVLYIMRKFLLEQMKSDKDSKGNTRVQQDVAEFLRIIFNMIDNEPTIKKVLDRFRFKVNKKYECENKAITKESTKPDPALFLQLYTDDYTKNSSLELQNKKKKDVGGLSLQNLIDYYSRNQVPTISSHNLTRDMIDGCGDDGVGKGNGTYSEQISLDDTNDYLIINPIKATESGRPSWQDTSIKIKAEALITVAENRYTIFGAILYSGSGNEGHYVYQRLYADGTSNINVDTDINKLPFIMYNTGKTTANDTQGYTILDNATLIIYKRVRGDAAAAAASAASAASSSNSKEAMANADKVDNQLTEDEKRNMSITSNRVQQIAEAAGLTMVKVREILEAKEIQERGGAAAAAGEGAPGAGSEGMEGESGDAAAPPEQQEQTLEAFIEAELGRKSITEIEESEKQRIIEAGVQNGFTKENMEAYFASKAAPAAAAGEAHPPAPEAPVEAAPPASARPAPSAANRNRERRERNAARKAQAEATPQQQAGPLGSAPGVESLGKEAEEARRARATASAVPATEEADEEEASAEAVSGAPPPPTEEGMAETGAAAPSGNNQRGQGAPVKYSNNLTRAREAAVKRAKEKIVSNPSSTDEQAKIGAAALPRANNQIGKATLKPENYKGLQNARKTLFTKTALNKRVKGNSLSESEKNAVNEYNKEQTTLRNSAITASKYKEAADALNKSIKNTEAVIKTDMNISQNMSKPKKERDSALARLYNLRLMLKSLKQKRHAIPILTSEEERTIEEEADKLVANGATVGGRRKTNKHKTKTFKKRLSKKRSNKTFKRRK
jgi:hypothetical protein